MVKLLQPSSHRVNRTVTSWQYPTTGLWKARKPHMTQRFIVKNPVNTEIIATITSIVMNKDDITFLCLNCIYVSPDMGNFIAVTYLFLKSAWVLKSSAIPNQMCGWEKPIPSSAGVCNDYNLPKHDETDANVSAYVHNDVKLYQSPTFGM